MEPAQEQQSPAITYYEASSRYQGTSDARERHEELRQRDLLARSYAILKARGEYDPHKHGAGNTEPLTAAEHLEILATGEVLARYYRHPADVDGAVKAGASWQQVAEARAITEDQARQDYRDWADGQHRLWTQCEGKFGMDDAEYCAAIERAAVEEREAGQ